jgi:hypothetical protein
LLPLVLPLALSFLFRSESGAVESSSMVLPR